MSARELGVSDDVPCIVNQEGDRGPIPRQLSEAIELISSANQKIEDCAVEWQAKISPAQWRILYTKPVDNKPWEQSVLARTYFADKTLDDAFQGLLRHNKTFTDHLQNFVALVRGEQPTMTTRRTCNAQNQCSEFCPREEEQLLPSSSLSTPVDLARLENHPDPRNGERKSDSVLAKAQKSFTNLIKAKIDFDTKFLGFEATLNGNICAMSDTALSLCQICSRVLGCGTQGKVYKRSKHRKNIQQCPARRSHRIKYKRSSVGKLALKIKERKLFKKIARESTPDIPPLDDQSAVTTGGV